MCSWGRGILSTYDQPAILRFSSSVVSDALQTPWTAARQASLSITNSRSLPKLMFTEPVMSSSHLILCRPLLPLPSMFSSSRVFSNEPVLCTRWPKGWSFSFNTVSYNEHSGLISLRMDWLDLFEVQDSQAEIDVFWNSLAFSMIQWMLAIWSLVPLPFLKPAWTPGSSCIWKLLWKHVLENFEHYFAQK